MSFMEPIAYWRGSTILAAPACRAATTPAPYSIPPWVSVGPSSITRTRLPANPAPSSRVTGLRPLIRTASGLTSRAERSTSATCSGVAESTLLMTIASAIRKFISPG